MEKLLYQIQAKHFTAGLEVRKFDAEVVFAAPIVKYMKGWSLGEVEVYCEKKGWKIIEVDTGGCPKPPEVV